MTDDTPAAMVAWAAVILAGAVAAADRREAMSSGMKWFLLTLALVAASLAALRRQGLL